jgi:multiple sugar transport system substrate-binding protein
MKRRTLILMLVLAMIVAACGGGDDDATTETTSGGDTPATSGDGGGGDEITLDLARFFGDCDETTQGVTDVSLATSECEVVQILTNAFDEADNGITINKLGGQAWDSYYTQLSTTFASGNPPNVAVMHSHRLPDFAGRDLLLPLDDELEGAGIDFSDYTEPAQEGAKWDGTIYAVPWDIHGSLWHMNVDIFTEAGLVDGDGNPIIPTSVDELIEQAQTIQDTTGKMYFSQDWFEFGVGARLFLGLVAQQGGSITDSDGSATVDTPEGQEALRLMNELAAQFSDPDQGYTDSQAGFLNGDIAVLHNGTWVVDQYSREAPFEYMVTSLPTIYSQPGAWGDSHMWVLPAASNEDPEVRAASLEFVKFLYDNIAAWARGTGHMANRKSILESGELDDAPQRSNYADFAEIAVFVPAVPNWAGAWDALAEELNATWVADKDQSTALADAEARMNEELGR